MRTISIRRSVLVGVVVFSFGWSGMIVGACGSTDPIESACTATDPDPPVEQATACAEPVKPCKKLYRIELLGNLTDNIELQKRYKAKFGKACYVAAANNSFNCYFETPQIACKEVMFVPIIFGAAKYEDHPTTCKNVPGTENWSLQTGSDPANVTNMYFEDPPLETSLIDVDGVPTEVNGPYRNLPQMTTIEIGKGFDCKTGIPGPDGGTLSQRDWFIQVNQSANDGGIRSDMAGFEYPCKVCGKSTTCTEPEFLKDGPQYDPLAAQVNHVVRKTDLRGCKWGSNINSNAAVISGALNRHLYNNYPLKKEVEQVNKIPPYTYTP